MAGGSLAPAGVAKERAEQYQGKLTAYVIVACIVAAVGGSLFGYDIGISGNLFISSPHPPTCFFGKLFSLDSGLFFWLWWGNLPRRTGIEWWHESKVNVEKFCFFTWYYKVCISGGLKKRREKNMHHFSLVKKSGWETEKYKFNMQQMVMRLIIIETSNNRIEIELYMYNMQCFQRLLYRDLDCNSWFLLLFALI